MVIGVLNWICDASDNSLNLKLNKRYKSDLYLIFSKKKLVSTSPPQPLFVQYVYPSVFKSVINYSVLFHYENLITLNPTN